MATIREKKKDGKIISYEFSVCLSRDDKGKQVRRYLTWRAPEGLTPSKERKAAEKAADAWEDEIRKDYEKDLQNPERIAIKEIANKKTDFGKFILNVWFPLCIDDGEHKSKTIAFYNDTSKNIVEYFDGCELNKIDSIAVREFLYYLKKDKSYSAQYRNHHYRTLKMIFGFAEKQGIIKENPIANVERPKLERKKIDALSEEEAKKFFEALKNCPLDFRCMLTLLVTAGLRRGECVGLKWQDFDERRKIIVVERNVVYTAKDGVVINTPKTIKSVRTIPVLESTAELLGKLKRQRRRESPNVPLWNSFIFHSKNDIFLPKDPNSVTHRLKRFMKRNNLPDLSPHDLRHSCATLLLKSGADIKSIQEIMGHTDARTTLNFYVKSDIEQMRNAIDKYEKAFDL